MNNIIDSHQHFWDTARGDYGWLSPELGVLYDDFAPDNLAPILAEVGIEKTVLVQAAPTLDETHYLLSLADQYRFIAGVVGWVDMASPTAASDIATLAKHPKLKGIRPMIQDIPDPDWMIQPAVAPAYEALLKSGLRFDALVHTKHLENLLTVMHRYPELPVVIDHAAKPDIASGQTSEWAERIAAIAENTNAFCKLSGLVTEAGESVGSSDIQPYFQHIFECFGARRLMWGSDWPVAKLRMEYADWLSMTQELLIAVPGEDRDQILAGTAARFYGLGQA